MSGLSRGQLEPPRESKRKNNSSEEPEAGVKFATTWRRNAATEMGPAGEIYPLYQGRERQEAVVLWLSLAPIGLWAGRQL
jgi:hypothetical protein